MGVQRRKRHGSRSANRSPRRSKPRELRSRAILEQNLYNEPANLPDLDPSVEPGPYMMGASHAIPWVQQDEDCGLLFNPLQMNLSLLDEHSGLLFEPFQMDLSMLDDNPDAINPASQICCPELTPELLSGLDSNLTGFNFLAGPYSTQYSDMASPSSPTDSLDFTDASLPHNVLGCLI
ncbi:hypothetical protein V8C42DRAFT_364055 [Trichoderma barbatum]